MECFRPPNDNCSETQTIYMWNTTNPAEARAAKGCLAPKGGSYLKGVAAAAAALARALLLYWLDSRCVVRCRLRCRAPAQVLEGAPPQLQEVGPFVMRQTTARYNIAFDHARRRVSYQSMTFSELLEDASCAACTYDAKARQDNRPLACACLSVR
jgi:hypothetical protein